MASEGPRDPGTMSSEIAGGVLPWVAPDNAKTSNNIDAAVVTVAALTTEWLKAVNFGFSIPSGATIDGIKVEIEQQGAQTGSALRPTERNIISVKGGVQGGDNKSTGATMPSTEAYITYGGTSDLWGRTWDDTDINSSGFGVLFSANMRGNGAPFNRSSAFIDHMRITVYYTEAAGGNSQMFGANF